MESSRSTRPIPVKLTGSARVQDEPGSKKRKLRKGTQSCWECKRRKIRCTFTANSHATCDGCRHRGSRCISQEFPEERMSSKQEEFGTRLVRVETLLEQLSKPISSVESALSDSRLSTDDFNGLSVPSGPESRPDLFTRSDGQAEASLIPRGLENKPMVSSVFLNITRHVLRSSFCFSRSCQVREALIFTVFSSHNGPLSMSLTSSSAFPSR